ncbi:alpha/beta hydrolase family protein [Pseudorhodoplanes sp.]|uniref:alpha/beta hydrolase family protein n=1 Tax=Pseudorhodoplanes sp. TaxID=1934341 RepID=UPI00391A3F0A
MRSSGGLAPACASPRRLAVACLALMLAAALPGLSRAQPPELPPTLSNELAVRIVDFDWVDAARARPVPARLYWPNDSAPGARVPLVVFSHGMGGSRRGYSYLARHFAARGVASLHVQHAGSDTSVWAGNPLLLVQRLQTAAHESEALSRGLDIRFALDRILASGTGPYAARIDRSRIVAAGHSYGANTALVAVGAGVMREGRRIEAKDGRFAAAILISSPPFYGEPDLSSVLDNVTVPTLHVTATEDVIRIPGYYSGPADRLAIYNAIATPRKAIAVFNGGSHSMFTDRTSTGGRDLNPKVKAATAELALAFLDQIFDGDRAAMVHWNAKWQPILALAPGVSPHLSAAARARPAHAVQR